MTGKAEGYFPPQIMGTSPQKDPSPFVINVIVVSLRIEELLNNIPRLNTIKDTTGSPQLLIRTWVHFTEILLVDLKPKENNLLKNQLISVGFWGSSLVCVSRRGEFEPDLRSPRSCKLVANQEESSCSEKRRPCMVRAMTVGIWNPMSSKNNQATREPSG